MERHSYRTAPRIKPEGGICSTKCTEVNSYLIRDRRLRRCGNHHWQPRLWPMLNAIDIDRKHSMAIVREIGERLRSVIKEEPELPIALRLQLERLRKFEAA
jgi:hypothetical protein